MNKPAPPRCKSEYSEPGSESLQGMLISASRNKFGIEFVGSSWM